MVSRPTSDICERIRRACRHFKLQHAQVAAELRIRPEWLSKILNGHQPVSYNIGLRFEDFLRRRGLAPDAFAVEDVAPVTLSSTRPADLIRKRVEEELRLLLASAGDDSAKLEAIATAVVQLRIKPAARVVRSARSSVKIEPASRSIESHPTKKAEAVCVPRDFDRRDFIADRYRRLAGERHDSHRALAS